MWKPRRERREHGNNETTEDVLKGSNFNHNGGEDVYDDKGCLTSRSVKIVKRDYHNTDQTERPYVSVPHQLNDRQFEEREEGFCHALFEGFPDGAILEVTAVYGGERAMHRWVLTAPGQYSCVEDEIATVLAAKPKVDDADET